MPMVMYGSKSIMVKAIQCLDFKWHGYFVVINLKIMPNY